MKALLICPAERPAVATLARAAPLATLPIFGKSLIEYWLEHLFGLNAKEVFILAADRPEQVRALVGDGARYGLHVEVFPEIRELTAAEARAKYQRHSACGWLAAPDDASVIDHLPGAVQQTLFESYSDWFAAIQALLPRAATPDRIGVRETQPGIWTGLHTHVSPSARLHAPCWLGQNVSVGPSAVIGPMAVLEDRVFVEANAEVSHSIVGPETFVGKGTELRDSMAYGNTLINWRDGACVIVPDEFLLCSLHRPRAPKSTSLQTRVAALLVMALTSPVVLSAALRVWLHGQTPIRTRLAVRPQPVSFGPPVQTLVYYEFLCANKWLRRWPQLWNVARGDFAWVGNRPLSPADAGRLANDFERLWLSAPIGLVSLADAEACTEWLGDEAFAHASYYAAQANWRLDWSILTRAMCVGVASAASQRRTESYPISFSRALLKEES